MNKLSKKIFRYRNIIKKVKNWPGYLLNKSVGFQDHFDFNIRQFGTIRVQKEMLGPFRENFFDEVYWHKVPLKYLSSLESPVIIDVGANVGFFSLAAFCNFPEAIIYAFEPHPFCSKKINEFKEIFPQFNWHIVPKAVSNINDKIVLNTTTTNGFATMTTMMEDNYRPEHFSVDSVRLDEFLANNKIEKIDFMKLDCEGAEYSILYDLEVATISKIQSMAIETHRGKGERENLVSLNKFLINSGFKTKVNPVNASAGYIWAWRE